VRDEDLELELIRSGRVEAIQGEVLEIPWKIQNLGQRDINRVSVYATPLNGGFEPIEILVGKIDAKSSRRGVLKLTVPASASLAPSYLRIGAAVDSLAALSKHADLTITAKPRTTSELVPEFQFLDGANSSQTHRLDANESAKFRMSIYNRGIAPTRSAKLRIVNLSGKQVQIEEKSYELGSIGQSERKSFEVPITAEADLDHRTPLHFGIEIVSDDLAEPIRETIVINEQHATKSDQLAH
jgi:uncharacterized membrane protein